MKKLEEIREILRAHREELESSYRVRELGIFGSFARGEQRKKSDLDFLVEFDGKPDIFLLIDLEDYLAGLTGRKVDLVRKGTIRDELKDIVEREVVYL